MREHSRLISSLSDFLIDTIPAAVYGPVLSTYYGFQGTLVLDVSCEPGNFRNKNDNLETLSLLTGTNDSVNQGFGNLISDDIAIRCRRDAKRMSRWASIECLHMIYNRTKTGFLWIELRNELNSIKETINTNIDKMLCFLNHLQVYVHIWDSVLTGRIVTFSQAFWILCSVSTPWDQSLTLRTTWTVHVPFLGSGYSGSGSTRPCHLCLYFWPIPRHLSRWGWPGIPSVTCTHTKTRKKSYTYGQQPPRAHIPACAEGPTTAIFCTK